MLLRRAALALAAAVALAGCGAGGPAASGPRDDIVLAGAATAQETSVAGTGSTPTPGATTSRIGSPAAAGVATTAGTPTGGPAGSGPRVATTTTSPGTAGPTTASTPGPCTLQRPGGAVRIDLSAATLGCGPATALLTAYLAAVDDGSHGNTKALVVSGWVCQSPTASESQASGVIAACAQNGATVTARSTPAS